jgi:gluconolactonase
MTAGAAGMPVPDNRPVPVAGSCPGGPYAALPFVAPPQVIAFGQSFTYLEGPLWSKERGSLLFSDFGRSFFFSAIYELVPGQPEATTLLMTSQTNGLAFDPSGQLFAADTENQAISLIDLAGGTKTPVVEDYAGATFGAPNDLAFHYGGTMYFTDPWWELYERAHGVTEQTAYLLPPGGELAIIQSFGMMGRPNGVTLSPDHTLLYLSLIDGDQDQILVYDVAEDGSTSNGRQFLATGSDGMAMDCAGNLYITNQGVHVYSPEGTLLGSLEVGTRPSNVAFGGADQQTLFITGETTLYAAVVDIPGFPY